MKTAKTLGFAGSVPAVFLIKTIFMKVIISNKDVLKQSALLNSHHPANTPTIKKVSMDIKVSDRTRKMNVIFYH